MGASANDAGRQARPGSRKTLGLAVIIWILLCYVMVEWPVLAWANRIEPFILGLPFSYFWLTFWYVMMTVGGIFAALYVWRP